MPRFGGGVYEEGKGGTPKLNGMPSAGSVKMRGTLRRGPKGRPSSGEAGRMSPQAAAKRGERMAKQPRS